MATKEISAKIARKCEKAIVEMTSSLGQVLKQFEGIYSAKLPETDGMTVEDFMLWRGVERKVTASGVKKGYTPAAIFGAWDSRLKRSDKAAIFTYHSAYCEIDPNTCDEFGIDHENGECAILPVYTLENVQRESRNRRPIRRYLLREVKDNRWSVATILKGLRQSAEAEKEITRNNKLESEWENYDKVYIIFTSKNDGKEYSLEVNKDDVKF